MSRVSRRSFLSTAAAAVAASAIPAQNLFAATATPLIGLQLYSVREDLAKDFPGTLKRVAAVGYREVEAAGFYNHSAGDVKRMMSEVGLRCVSAHYSLDDLLKSTDAIVAYAKALGLEYVICSAPWGPDPARLMKYPGGPWQWALHAMTLDDWKWNADQFNQLGCRMQEAGLKFGYHNHTMAFRKVEGSTGYRVLLEDTDPRCVTLELDCGWAIAGGQNPAEMLRKYPGRFSMLHLKDLKPVVAGTGPSERVSTVIGSGTVDFRPIFAAAEATGVRHYFVEQEDFDGPVFQQIAADYKSANILARGGSLQKL
ncbi:MAG TPA: sugar phosphate isomerase/epimerase [Silvibacterium sp.]|nr:sugar phosphate isomerase/epimerase [Silvibacterium sp.]